MDRRLQDESSDQGSPTPPRTSLWRQIMLWLIVVAAILTLMSAYGSGDEPEAQKVEDLLKFEQMIREPGTVVQVRLEDSEVRARLGGEEGEQVRLVIDRVGIEENQKDWKAILAETGGQLTYTEPTSQIWYLLLNMLPFVLLILVAVWFFRRQMGGGAGRDSWSPFISSSTAQARKERPGVTFEDVAGVEEAKEEVQELVEFLKKPEKFQRIGGRIPRGVLLVGAPGTGKTLLAKAIAGEADAPFFSLCGSDFVELFVGVGAARVRDLFKKARESQPAIIFLDEIDAVGRKRGTGLGGGHDEREQTLNAILSEMDGFARDEGVIVIAATNRPDVLDPALLRPGRFDREIVVDMPDLRGRREILAVHMRDVKSEEDLDLEQIARGTPGFTGADLEALVNEAAIGAAIKGHPRVSTRDLEEARDKVRFGRSRKNSRIMSEEDRRMTAYHEAGHALLAHVEQDVEPLHKVTIIPRGVSLGMTMILPEQDKHGLRRRECLGQIRMNLAGRIAEDMFCGDISTGAENDIQNATTIARRMVTRWGMSEKLGPISYSEEEQHVFLGNELTQAKHHSDSMAAEIDAEIRSIVTGCYEETRRLLEEQRESLQTIAEALLEVETLSGDEVGSLLQGDTLDGIRQARAEKERAETEQRGQDIRPDEPLPGSPNMPRPSPA